MKNKVMLAVLILLITISTVAGATYAWFTDVETSMSNTFSTGTVEISMDRDWGDPVPGPMFYTTAVQGANPDGKPGKHPTGLWFPGKSETRLLDVRNVGSLEVRLVNVGAQITSLNGSDPSENAVLATSFAVAMNVKIHVSSFPDEVLYNGTLANLLLTQTCTYKPEIAAYSGGYPPTVQLSYEVSMSESAGNDLQDIVPIVSFWVGAEQTANNP